MARGGLRQSFEEVVSNVGDGAVYWGWLSMLVGLVGPGAHYTVDWDPELPAAVAVALLSVLYGYAIKFFVCCSVRNSCCRHQNLQRIVQPL